MYNEISTNYIHSKIKFWKIVTHKCTKYKASDINIYLMLLFCDEGNLTEKLYLIQKYLTAVNVLRDPAVMM